MTTELKKRIAAVEKRMKTGGGYCHVVIAPNDETADQNIKDIKKWDSKPKAILAIIRGGVGSEG